MATWIIYLAKASVCLIIFSAFFRLLLMRETFFRFTRFLLLTGIIVSCVLPLIKIRTVNPSIFQKPVVHLEEFVGNPSFIQSENRKDAVGVSDISDEIAFSPFSEAKEIEQRLFPAFSWVMIVGFIWLTGIFVMLLRLFVSLIRLKSLFKRGRITEYNGVRVIVCLDDIASFSFFNRIVLSEADYRNHPDEIILHEQMHIRYKHSWDVILSEFLLMVYWFNPAMWSLCRDLREIHEYEADNAVINKGINAQPYQLLLVKKTVGERRFTSVANSFNQSKIKNRITMMLRKESTPWARLKILVAVPLMVGMLLAFSRPEVEKSAEALLHGNRQESIIDKVQTNPFFYWEQVSFFCKEKGLNSKELEKEFRMNTNRNLIMILINHKNQILFVDGKKEQIFKNKNDIDKKEIISTLKEIIAYRMNENGDNPLYFILQSDVVSSTDYITKVITRVLLYKIGLLVS